MKTLRFAKGLFFVCCLIFQATASAQQTIVPSAIWQVYFSPHGGATSAIVQSLDNAKSTVLVQAYFFTSEAIVDALMRAHERGVKVQVIFDKSQRTQRYSVLNTLVKAGIPTLIDATHAIVHNKVMIIDNNEVVTGSFNYTKAAEERNAESLLIISSK